MVALNAKKYVKNRKIQTGQEFRTRGKARILGHAPGRHNEEAELEGDLEA